MVLYSKLVRSTVMVAKKTRTYNYIHKDLKSF